MADCVYDRVAGGTQTSPHMHAAKSDLLADRCVGKQLSDGDGLPHMASRLSTSRCREDVSWPYRAWLHTTSSRCDRRAGPELDRVVGGRLSVGVQS